MSLQSWQKKEETAAKENYKTDISLQQNYKRSRYKMLYPRSDDRICIEGVPDGVPGSFTTYDEYLDVLWRYKVRKELEEQLELYLKQEEEKEEEREEDKEK